MIKQVYATSEHNPALGRYGNCMSACLAAILDIPVGKIPNFDNPEIFSDKERDPALRSFLYKHGFNIATLSFYGGERNAPGWKNLLQFSMDISGGAPCILSGATARCVNHAVVAQDGAVIMNPSNNSVVQPTNTGYYYLELLIRIQPHWDTHEPIRFLN